MSTTHFKATVKDSLTLELPAEAHSLGLAPGDEVHLFVVQKNGDSFDSVPEQGRQADFQASAARLFEEADATERIPGTYADSRKASIAEQIAQKHRKMGLNI